MTKKLHREDIFFAAGYWLLATGSFNGKKSNTFFNKLPEAKGQKPEAKQFNN